MNSLIIGKREAISNVIRKTTSIVDLDKRIYKIQESLFGIFKWGDFKPLPKLNYVLVFRSLFANCEPCAFDETTDNPNAFFQISLIYNKNRRIIVHETKDKTEAFALAKELATGLNQRVMDSASKPGKGVWLT